MDNFYELRRSAETIGDFVGLASENDAAPISGGELLRLQACLLDFVKAIEKLSDRLEKLDARVPKDFSVFVQKRRNFDARPYEPVGLRGARVGAKE